MITEFQYLSAADQLGCEVAVIKAVAEVEAFTSAELETFVTRANESGVSKYLSTKNWDEFSRAYYGAMWRKNLYDVKLKTAWLKWAG